MEEVILVDQEDNAIGTMEKMEAHRLGELHRAFSVLVYNKKGELLLQQRAMGKYHSGGLWTNACCSHPRPGEKIADAARRRLWEEMGIDIDLAFSHKFLYKASLDQDLTEHELDHVFVGRFDGVPRINSGEVESWKFVGLSWLKADIREHPDAYTYWFRLIVENLPAQT